mgnify:FL=1|tara:strand:+ start:385 stop:657 length:273 start_codon:yes stop_codon:yes gene_type:complete
MEGTYFEKKFAKICKNFKFESLDKPDKEYLVDMYNQLKGAQTCPKTLKPFESLYPNSRNFCFYSGDRPEGTSYGSHLLNGTKYHIVWDHD